MLRKGEAAVKTALRELQQDAHNAPDEVLFRLAEERGLNPDMVVSIATKLGWKTSLLEALQPIWLLEMQREQRWQQKVRKESNFPIILSSH